MKREELISLGVPEEALDRIMEINGADIEAQKAALQKANAQIEGLNEQIKSANDTIKGFKDLDVDGLKNGIKSWEKRYNEDTKALQDKLLKQAKESKIDFALMGAKAKNVKAVRALLDHEKITLDGENLIGLSDQLTKITQENPYLFGEGEKNPPPPAGGYTPPNVSDMSDADYYAYMTKKKE